MKRVGLIGLGNMGSGMAKNLLKSGFDVLGYDTATENLDSLSGLGLQKASGIGGVAKKCETVILCLPNPSTSQEVIFKYLLSEGSQVLTIIETSTLTPELVVEFASKLGARDKQFLSAPMVGGKNHAANGTIEFLIEGQEAVFKRNSDIFMAMGSKSRFMGDFPSATLAKLTFNLCRYTNLAVAVEAYRLLKEYNANTEAIHQFMSEQSLDNFGQVWAEDMKDTMTKDIPFKPSQVPKKDLSLLSEMAKSHKVDDGIIEAVRKTYLSME